MFWDTAKTGTLDIWLAPFSGDQRIFWLYLVSALFLTAIAYWQLSDDHETEDHRRQRSLRDFLAYVFDKRVWLHPSSFQDVKFFFVNGAIYYGIVAQFMLGVHGFAILFYAGLNGAFGPLDTPVLGSAGSLIIYTFASIIAIDLGVYLTHLAQHKIPVLWQFHKVHHSALVLTPLTLFRMHPVDLIFTSLMVAFLKGIVFAGLFFLSAKTPEAYTILGLNLITFLFYILGYNLRHSHIWLNYPVWLSKILISPAQHQIHHSSDPKHFDKNMGLIFAFWDRLFGTHYIPHGYEKLSYGIDGQEPNPFKSVTALYLKPFTMAFGLARSSLSNTGRRFRAYAGVCGFYGFVFALIFAYSNLYLANHGRTVDFRLKSIALEFLTWTEVETAVAKGYDRIIIPTGGTEQNGPHVVLGKHNLIIEHTAIRIARRIGNTLVAPVMAYVPEGEIEPKPTGHMAFAGTLSIPEAVFEQVLEATARSLKAHGFRHIFFLGDSGGNQKAQKKIADKLTREWATTGVQVVQVSDYYFINGQTGYLLDQGYSRDQIGTHAGIRDTSELKYVAKSRVRARPLEPQNGQPSGANGDHQKASAEIGKKMIELKIDAAVKQMHQALGVSAAQE